MVNNDELLDISNLPKIQLEFQPPKSQKLLMDECTIWIFKNSSKQTRLLTKTFLRDSITLL